MELFLRAEDAYFGCWDPARFAAAGRAMPGELLLTDLFGTEPGPARYLLEPFLDADGRREYRDHLIAILRDLDGLKSRCDDGGRLARIEKAITVTLTLSQLWSRTSRSECDEGAKLRVRTRDWESMDGTHRKRA